MDPSLVFPVIYFVDYIFFQRSTSVSVDLLTYGDLESLRNQQHHRTGFGTQHIPGAKTRSQLHSKRYLIMTYTVEYDRLAIGVPKGFMDLGLWA